MNNTFHTWNQMRTPSNVLSLKRFEQVCRMISANPDKIADFIDGGDEGWENTNEHNEWLVSASAKEIASWVSAELN